MPPKVYGKSDYQDNDDELHEKNLLWFVLIIIPLQKVMRRRKLTSSRELCPLTNYIWPHSWNDTMWGPLVVSWFIEPISYIYQKPYLT